MAIFQHHKACPSCGSSDARAVYSDGSEFCFSCGVPSRASIPSFKSESSDYDEETIEIPNDLTHDFPPEVVQWLAPTGVKIEELIAHGYFFSKSSGKLVRALYKDDDQNIHQYSGRSWGAREDRTIYTQLHRQQPKSQFFGSKAEIKAYSYRGRPYDPLQQALSCGELHVAPNQKEARQSQLVIPRQLVIVEDSISSIKAGRTIPCAPLFGSMVSKDKLTSLVKPFDEVFVWLDSDKLNEARKIADQLRMVGKKASVIFTELDPKYCNAEEFIRLC